MQLTDFPFVTTDKVRYNDTDRQGHVNNAVFATYMELARVEVLHHSDLGLREDGASLVLARLVIDFRAEIHFPGEVQIGTRVGKVGRSSIARLKTPSFSTASCAATAKPWSCWWTAAPNARGRFRTHRAPDWSATLRKAKQRSPDWASSSAPLNITGYGMPVARFFWSAA